MRGLTAPVADLTEGFEATCDRRLTGQGPVCVAVSGGGDSTALAWLAAQWARRRGRALTLLNVDHQLNPGSAGWARDCEALATRLGAGFRGLRWDGAKPATGLPAAARAARHALLARAAREVGAQVVLMGHNRDDLAEAAVMRAEGASVPDPREWAPSPAWPEGRGVFLLRPLLGVGRRDLRDWLAARGEAWVEDPANENPAYARARARRALAAGGEVPPDPAATRRAAGARCVTGAHLLQAPRQALRMDPLDEAARLVAAACLSVSGGSRPPRPEASRRLAERLIADGPVTATLAGARVEADEAEVRFMRHPGEMARRGVGPLALAGGDAGVWDGRYEVTARQDVVVRPVAGLASQLGRADQALLKSLPPGARGALPAILAGDGPPRLGREGGDDADVRPLALMRFRGAAGLIEDEAGI